MEQSSTAQETRRGDAQQPEPSRPPVITDPAPSTARGGDLLGFLVAARPWLRGTPKLVLHGVGALIGIALLDAIPPFLYRALFDEAIPDRNATLMIGLSVALILSTALEAGCEVARAISFSRLSARTGAGLRRALIDRVQGAALTDPRMAHRAHLIALVNADVEAVETTVLFDLPRALMGAMAVIACLVVLLILDWRLTLILLAATPLCWIAPWNLGRRARRAQAAAGEVRADVQSDFDDLVRGQRTIRAFGLTRYWADRLAEGLLRLEAAKVRAGILTRGIQGATSIATEALTTILLVGGAAMIFGGWLTIGSLIAFWSVFNVAIIGMTTMSESAPGLLRGHASMRRIEGLLAAPMPDDRGAEAPPLTKTLRLDGVRFDVGDHHGVLDGLDLSIRRGETVALVGPSGAGKSTVLGILLGFHTPCAGCVRWDDQDVTAFSRHSLLARMAVVFQETEIFAMSVADNIRLGQLDATDEQGRAAARAAELHDDIEALPKAYDTLLGEGHLQLSGGQRQRLAIARAVLRDPEVLLLDEPTSALDARTEACVNETLARLTHDRTVITVTHRLANARFADRIIVLRQGHIVETGTHDELLAKGGLYAELTRRQQAVQIDRGTPRIKPSLLAEIPLFADLSDDVRTRLAELFVAERRQADEVIIRAGEPGDRFYVVARGELIVEVPTDQGPKRVGTLRDADVFGEIALLIDVPRSATVTARHETLMASLGRDDFLALLDAHPEARARITAEAERRLAEVRAVKAAT
ncbi:MAG: ATP-binding cassette domain-containing protein [Myxococcales bacterium]|nr:ATP-binding cassette domain-containing protein [Myxococcales bacterium]